jgi:hypothetical protein
MIYEKEAPIVFTPTESSVRLESAGPDQLLIKEARAASRRRRLNWFAAIVAAVIVASLIVVASIGISRPKPHVGSGGNDSKGAVLTILPCTSTDVTVANGPLVSEAQEEEGHSLKVTNEGAKSCLMSGFPRLIVYGSTGAAMPFLLEHHPTADFALTSKAPKPFALAAHKSAYVRFEQFGCMAGTETTTNKVALLLPKSTYPTKVLTLLRPIALCVGASAKQANPIGISPFEPTYSATGAYYQPKI